MEHFRTRRLIARDWTPQDARAAFDIYGRDEVARWLGAQPRRPVASLAQMRERLDLMIQRSADEPDYGLWAVEVRTGPAAGTVVGSVLHGALYGLVSTIIGGGGALLLYAFCARVLGIDEFRTLLRSLGGRFGR